MILGTVGSKRVKGALSPSLAFFRKLKHTAIKGKPNMMVLLNYMCLAVDGNEMQLGKIGPLVLSSFFGLGKSINN